MKYRFCALSIIVVGALAAAYIARAYEPEPTHRALAQKSAEVFNQFLSGQISREEINWIGEGARNEDTPPRWINHFYDPTTGRGWTSERMGKMPASVVGAFSGLALSTEKAAPAPVWAQDQNLQAKYNDYLGNRTWQKAVFDYVNGDKKEAFKDLGHILHLIADMSVPAHTRQDTHFAAAGDPGEPYEKWTGWNTDLAHLVNLNLVRDKLTCIDLNDCFEQVARYSNENFFSEDTIFEKEYSGPLISFYKPVSDENIQYGYASDGRILVMAILNSNTKQIERLTLKDPKIHQAYWQLLSKEAVLAGAEVIRLFFDEVEKAQKDKSRLEAPPAPPISAFGNIYTGLAALYPQPRAIFSAYGEIAKLKNYFSSISSAVASFFNKGSEPIVVESAAPSEASGASGSEAPERVKASAPADTASVAPAPPAPSVAPLPANAVLAVEKVTSVPLPSSAVAAQEKLGGNNIAEEIIPQEAKIPSKIVEEIKPGQAQAPGLAPLSFLSGGGGPAPAASPVAQAALTPTPTPIPSPTATSTLASTPTPTPTPTATSTPEADITPPETNITSAPAATVATTSAVFAFDSTENGSLYACQLDNTTSTVCVSPQTYDNLAEGSHSFKVSAKDEAGNEDSTPAEYYWSIDLSVPQISNIAAAPSRNAALISWTAPEAGIFQIEYGTSTIYGLATATTSAASLTIESLAAGTEYHFRLLATDNLGNASASDDQIFATTAQAANIVISEIKIGNTNAADDEWIELYNPTDSPIDLQALPLSLRIRNSAGTDNYKIITWTRSIIPAKGFFLLTSSSSYSGGVAVDAVYSTAGGGVKLVANGGVYISNSVSQGVGVIDQVGWGSQPAGGYESAAFDSSPSISQSLERKAFANSTSTAMVNGMHQWQGNGYDLDNNAQDFILQSSPNPQNSLMLTEPRETLPSIMAAAAWPTWQGNQMRTGLASVASIATSSMVIKWTATTTVVSSFNTRPVIDDEGSIYIGRGDGLAKYSSAGQLLWLFPKNSGFIAPLIAADGTIYYRENTGLYALNKNGQLKWQYLFATDAGAANGSLAILSTGAIITQRAEKIYAVNQDATLKWMFDPGRALRDHNQITAFTVDGHDNIFIGIDDYIYSISPAGVLRWEKKIGNDYTSLALGNGNILYVSVTVAGPLPYGGLFALDAASGEVLWADQQNLQSFEQWAYVAPAIGADNQVYGLMLLSNLAKRLRAYNASSTPDWSAVLYNIQLAAPIITSDNKIYLAEQMSIRVFDAATGEAQGGFYINSNPGIYLNFGALGADGTIYTANVVNLYAIGRGG